MSTPRRRRKDREPLNQIVGALATVPTAMGDIPDRVETFATEPIHEDIARRAHQLHVERGGQHGHDWEDWFQAERELRQIALRGVVDKTLATERRGRMPPLESLVARIRGEYSETPGLRLTFGQACRLWQLDEATCEMLLEHLVRETFLVRTLDGAYIALPSTPRSQAKAHIAERAQLPRSA